MKKYFNLKNIIRFITLLFSPGTRKYLNLPCAVKDGDVPITSFNKTENISAITAQVGVKVIPVVVHIVWNTQEQNLSEERINSQIKILNEDFRRLNADKVNTIPAFQSIATDCEIEFCLSGITRTQTSKVSFTDFLSMKANSTGGKDAWDTKKYLNIWVCNLVGAQGTGTYPINSGQYFDGVTVNYFGFGKTIYLHPRAATHEIGHYLGLKHPWGDDGGTCTGSDGVDDTPNQDNYFFQCDLNRHSCGSLDNTQNFMQNTYDYCRNMFTQGQKIVMQNTLATTRNELISHGCNPPILTQIEVKYQKIGTTIKNILSNNITLSPSPYQISTTIPVKFYLLKNGFPVPYYNPVSSNFWYNFTVGNYELTVVSTTTVVIKFIIK